METQTFQAREMKEVLALVRRELGPDAVVLETRRVPGRALGLLGGSLVQVTARKADPKPHGPAAVSRRKAEAEEAAMDVEEDRKLATANRHKALLALQRARRQKSEARRPRSLRDSIQDDPGTSIAAAVGAVGSVAPHAALRRRLLASLVPRDLCESWLVRLGKVRTRREAEAGLREHLRDVLGGPAPLLRRGSRVAVLVGPTGVGKTTTIAKLAAHALLVEEKSVALVSLDDHRVGAAAQLRAYGDVLGVPTYACASEESLARTLASLRDVELVLVDTAGVSPSDPSSLEHLRRRLRRAGETVSVHLCVAASTRQEELDRIVHVYRRVDPTALVATKLDEAVAVGSMFAARVLADAPFSFVTTGQQVPEDFAPATPQFLTDVLLGGDSA